MVADAQLGFGNAEQAAADSVLQVGEQPLSASWSKYMPLQLGCCEERRTVPVWLCWGRPPLRNEWKCLKNLSGGFH